MRTSVLVTGATGAVGTLVRERLSEAGAVVSGVARSECENVGGWTMGVELPPDDVSLNVDVVVHCAASTRWTMTKQEADIANVQPLVQLLELINPSTHLVYVSTAYALRSGMRPWRNEYERSKAECERLLQEWRGSWTIVRPPLIMGSSADGRIARFSGTYGLIQVLTSGLLAAVVGDRDGHIQIVPVDFVADAVVTAALEPTPSMQVDLGAADTLTMGDFVEAAVRALNEFRAARGIASVACPPVIDEDSWERFHFPFARDHLTSYHLKTIELLRIFGRYSTTAEPYESDLLWDGPSRELVGTSVQFWCAAHEQIALRSPRPWKGRP